MFVYKNVSGGMLLYGDGYTSITPTATGIELYLPLISSLSPPTLNNSVRWLGTRWYNNLREGVKVDTPQVFTTPFSRALLAQEQATAGTVNRDQGALNFRLTAECPKIGRITNEMNSSFAAFATSAAAGFIARTDGLGLLYCWACVRTIRQYTVNTWPGV